MLRSSTTSYYHADGLGSVTSLSNGAGSLAQTYAYDSFGKQLSSTGSLTNPFQYTGRESDSETSLYYYRARYYDPQVGRFASEDPVTFRGGLDFYLYANNDATNLIDPRGLLSICCRRANVSSATGWAWLTGQGNACHCFLRLSNGDTLGGYFGYGKNLQMLISNYNDESDHVRYANEAHCTELPGKSCENDARAKNAFGNLPKVIGVYGTAPGLAGTSNAVAQTLLNNAGFGWVKLPSCAWGATAAPWGDTFTSPASKGFYF
jgi:RHS repeat-associated protein